MEYGEDAEGESAVDMQRCPYLHEMKERLLGEQPPAEGVAAPFPADRQTMTTPSQQQQQQAVAVVVKCNPDGYGSHTSPTHRTPLMPKEPEDDFEYTLRRNVYPKNAKTSLFIIMSFVYAKLLVVVCVAYVVSDVVTHSIPLYYYEGFFTYLYGVSILFLLYVFCFLLQESVCCGAGDDAAEPKATPPPPPPPLPPPPHPALPEPDKEKKRKKQELKRKKEEKKDKRQEKRDEAEQPISLQWQFESEPPSAPAQQHSRAPTAPPAAARNGSPSAQARDVEAQRRRAKRKTSQNDQSHGSFFLRIGAIAFGLGAMIYTGLELGTFFEVPLRSPCRVVLRGVNPALQMVFTFMQMYFIFMNSRLNIHRFKVVARFGLAHIVATNLCVWIRTFVLEYLKDVTGYRPPATTEATPTLGGVTLHASPPPPPAMTWTTATPSVAPRYPATTPWRRMHPVTTSTAHAPTTLGRAWRSFSTGVATPSTSTAASTTSRGFFDFGRFDSLVANNLEARGGIDVTDGTELVSNVVPEAMRAVNLTGVNATIPDACARVNIMGTIVEDAGPYLYPFIVEYSLIGAAVIYVMWKHVGRNPRWTTREDLERSLDLILSRRAAALARGRVDCAGASKGLFLGLLLLVASTICLILFFVLVRHPDLGLVAVCLADASHCALMALSVVAIAVGFARVRALRFRPEERHPLNDILLRVSAFGLFLYSAFGAIAGRPGALDDAPDLLVTVTGALAILQVALQLLFISDVSRRRVHLAEHDGSRPGRQAVTLLLVCNIAMWLVYTFEARKTEADPVQPRFYGAAAWAAIQRFALPLCIFHRFHSAVTLAEIWRTSYEARLE